MELAPPPSISNVGLNLIVVFLNTNSSNDNIIIIKKHLSHNYCTASEKRCGLLYAYFLRLAFQILDGVRLSDMDSDDEEPESEQDYLDSDNEEPESEQESY